MSCEHYKFQDGLFGGDYYCIKQEKTVSTDTYYKYCRDYNYSACPIYKHTESSGCFITTIVCKILGKKDNDEILENFRNFRDNILQQNKKYYDTLKEYDIIGDMLVDCIENDRDKEKMASGVYRNILLPLNEKINNKEYDRAVNMYHCMTMNLISYYGLDREYNEIKANGYNYPSFNPKTSGHGYKVKKRNIQPNQKIVNNI